MLDDNTATFEVEAQVEGGKMARGTVMAPCDASRDYLLRRFIARHVTNPARRDFWFYQNKLRGKVRRLPDLSQELPDPRIRDPKHLSYLNWPAMRRA